MFKMVFLSNPALELGLSGFSIWALSTPLCLGSRFNIFKELFKNFRYSIFKLKWKCLQLISGITGSN